MPEEKSVKEKGEIKLMESITSQVTSSLDLILEKLAALVSFDTQNPPRAITADSDIFIYLRENLPGFVIELFDLGSGSLGLLAKRGNPELLFNFHIDTVPIAQGWTKNPFELTIEDNKAYALGACDIKGAAACMLSAISKTKGDVALLFTSDEEHGSSEAVKHFLLSRHGFSKVIIAEPTQAKAVLAHRGIQTARAVFKGKAGHASESRALTDSAIHKAAKWISATLDWVETQTNSFESLSGMPFNIGKINGGIKANMISSDCELSLGFRPLPGQDSGQILASLQKQGSCISHINDKDLQLTSQFFGPTLPAANQNFEQSIDNASALAKACALNIGTAVNFWTEASLFSEAGITAIVFGPGNITEAHTANEWVELKQLEKVEQHYIHIIEPFSKPSSNDTLSGDANEKS